MSESVVLYHFWPSLCSQKVRLVLAEKKVPYRSELINIGPPMENYSPAYAAINPRMVVPTLVIGEEIIVDSAKIVVEIDRRFPGPDLAADHTEVRDLVSLADGLQIREITYARRTGILGFLVKGSFEKRLQILETNRLAHPSLAHLYEARLEDVRRWREVSSSDESIEKRRAEVLQALAEIERALGGGEFLTPHGYSVADAVWTVMLARLKFMGFQGRFGPRTRDYYARVRARPSFHDAQVWDRIKPWVMLPIVAGVIGHRLGISRRTPVA